MRGRKVSKCNFLSTDMTLNARPQTWHVHSKEQEGLKRAWFVASATTRSAASDALAVLAFRWTHIRY